MKRTERAILWYARRAFALIVGVVGVTFAFFFSDIIKRTISRVGRFEVMAEYTGGRVAAMFYDPLGDDHGFGALVYPTNERFADGALDLISYTVHEPVYGAQATDVPEYWQLDLKFRGGKQDVRAIRVYIDADSDGKGSSSPSDERGEGVSFDPSRPWDYVLAIAGNDAEFLSLDGKVRLPVKLTQDEGGKKVMARIPLMDRGMRAFFEVDKTAHYVLVGALSTFAPDSFAPVGKRASSVGGGGVISALTPKVFDWLAPEGEIQEAALSSWNEDSLELPMLKPVESGMRGAKSSLAVNVDSELVSRYAKLAESERAADLAANEEALKSLLSAGEPAASDAKALVALGTASFNAGKKPEAFSWFEKANRADPDNPSALAYLGALKAQEAATESPLVAMEIVSSAYELLDRAVSLAKDPDDVQAARISRASTSHAIPESVFGKAVEGAQDYLAAADVLKLLPSDGVSRTAQIAAMYLNAAMCYEIAEDGENAGIWFTAALGAVNSLGPDARVAATRLELAKRGYLRN
ncbi:MAG TPA: glucodextranase DOMON-like domain-containing protein [Treponemataceae bacterium]|nr:glucodextranase DOMON-like domain-containing protein [Treponemataceae bacterium]